MMMSLCMSFWLLCKVVRDKVNDDNVLDDDDLWCPDGMVVINIALTLSLPRRRMKVCDVIQCTR